MRRENVYHYEGILEIPFETQYVVWRRENIGLTDDEKFMDYINRSTMAVIEGNYSEYDDTALSLTAEVVAGIAGVDAGLDAQDLAYNIDNWETTPGHIADTAITAASLLPLVGVFKKAKKLSELSSIAKQAKNAKE